MRLSVAYFSRTDATLESLRGHFGITLGSFWGQFGLLWGHLELTLSLLLAYEQHFGLLVVSSRVYEGQFSKITHFQHELQ